MLGIALLQWEWMLKLTPLNLLTTAGIIALFHKGRHRTLEAAGVVMMMGFLIEWVGVNTGWPFGAYQYGDVLGWKWMGTPLIIGVNWFVLMYATHGLAQFLSNATWVRALIGASFMLLIDILIEPVAMALNFWQWEGGHPPLENYMAWFGIAACLSWLMSRLQVKTNSALAFGIYAIECSFFAVLYWTVK